MRKKILLTGGTGYVGGSIISKLNSQYDFINLGRNKVDLCNNVEWNFDNKIEINEEIDTIIHCAAIVGNNCLNFSEYVNANVKFTSDLLDFCTNNNVKNFIYLSTGGVYGFNENKFKETDKCNPKGLYNLSKKFSEDLCLLKSSEMRVIINRLFFPYGPNQKGRLFDNLIKSIIKEKKVDFNMDGRPVINPIYVDDLVDIINCQVENDNEGIFNLSGMEELSIKNIVEIMNSFLNISELKYIYNYDRLSNLLGDNEKIVKTLNYKFKNNIEDSIKKIVKLY